MKQFQLLQYHGSAFVRMYTHIPVVAERLRRAYPALPERAGVGSIPANPDAQNVPSFRRWRFEMKLSPFYSYSRVAQSSYDLFVDLNRDTFDFLQFRFWASDFLIYVSDTLV